MKQIPRRDFHKKIKTTDSFDVIVIGGGATGLGVALDAVSRGFSVLLLEMDDFGNYTSSKSTKLLHGGVRYLQNGDVRLVIEALKERKFVLENAPHLSKIQNFVIPVYDNWKRYYYYAGLSIYDLLSMGRSTGKTKWLSKEETIEKLPNINQKDLKGGIEYTDGQFDDARLCIDLVHTIIENGGICLNQAEVYRIMHDKQNVYGVEYRDRVLDEHIFIKGKVVINCAGVFSDDVSDMGDVNRPYDTIGSRGSHIVVSKDFLKTDNAIMIPETSDGRVLFIIPWKNVAIIGTTDVFVKHYAKHPYVSQEEVDYLLESIKDYLTDIPTERDILSRFAGIRPLPSRDNVFKDTKDLSRRHRTLRLKHNFYAVIGGKWTTFREMGEETIDMIIDTGDLPDVPSNSKNIKILNGNPTVVKPNEWITDNLPYSIDYFKYSIENEYVVDVEDLLCRRSRALFINKEEALAIMPFLVDLMSTMRGENFAWKRVQEYFFKQTAKKF